MGPYVWNGDALGVLEWRDSPSEGSSEATRLRVIDLHDPSALTTATLPLRADRLYTGLIADADRLRTTHSGLPPEGENARVKFYADSFDISDPRTPRALPSVNIPGVLAQYDAASGQAITAELHRVVVRGVTEAECLDRFDIAELQSDVSEHSGESASGTCTGYEESLNLVTLNDAEAVIQDTFRFPAKQSIRDWGNGDARLFVTSNDGSYVFSGFGSAKLHASRPPRE